MAFSDGGGSVWKVDLTTRAGARSAAYQAALACFIFAGLTAFGAIMLGSAQLLRGPAAVIGFGVMALELAVALVAGYLLRQGKGAWWGVAVAVLIGISLAGQMINISIMGLMIFGVLEAFLINGLRGAFALRGDAGFEDDDIGVFN